MGKIVEDFQPIEAGAAPGTPPEAPMGQTAAQTQFQQNAPAENPDITPLVTRVGVPMVAAMSGAGAGAQALWAAGSELAAQQMEQGAHVPTLGDVGQGAIAAGASVLGNKVVAPVVTALGKAVAWPMQWVANKVFVPKDFMDTASPAATTYKVLRQLGSSPTPGQVLDNDLVDWLEGITRGAAFGKREMTHLDEQNMRLVTGAVRDYVDTHANMAWQPQTYRDDGTVAALAKTRFGQMAEAILTGKMKMAELVNGQNYNKFRQAINGKGLEVDATPAADFYDKNSANPFVQQVYGSIKQWMGDGIDPIPAEHAYEAVRMLNSYLGSGTAKGEKWAAGQLKSLLEPALKSGIANEPGAVASLETANTVFSKMATNVDNQMMGHLRDVFNKTPTAALQTIMAGEKRLEVLNAVERAYSTGASGDAGTSLGGARAFQQNIIEPLRYHVLQQAADPQTGNLMGKQLLANLNRLGDDFGEKVFGGAQGLQAMKDLATTAQRLQESQQIGNRAMYIKLVQGGLMSSLAFGFTAGDEDTGATRAKKVAAVLLAPAVLARYVMGNPATTRVLIDGMQKGFVPGAMSKGMGQLISLSLKELSMPEGLRQVYTDPKAHQLADRPNGNAEAQLQFIPEDQMERNMLQMQAPPGMPMQ